MYVNKSKLNQGTTIITKMEMDHSTQNGINHGSEKRPENSPVPTN
jgi:hypothetical protein